MRRNREVISRRRSGAGSKFRIPLLAMKRCLRAVQLVAGFTYPKGFFDMAGFVSWWRWTRITFTHPQHTKCYFNLPWSVLWGLRAQLNYGVALITGSEFLFSQGHKIRGLNLMFIFRVERRTVTTKMTGRRDAKRSAKSWRMTNCGQRREMLWKKRRRGENV